jgi:hypothetical protein
MNRAALAAALVEPWIGSSTAHGAAGSAGRSRCWNGAEHARAAPAVLALEMGVGARWCGACENRARAISMSGGDRAGALGTRGLRIGCSVLILFAHAVGSAVSTRTSNLLLVSHDSGVGVCWKPESRCSFQRPSGLGNGESRVRPSEGFARGRAHAHVQSFRFFGRNGATRETWAATRHTYREGKREQLLLLWPGWGSLTA